MPKGTLSRIRTKSTKRGITLTATTILPRKKKKQLNRLSKAIGHLQHVKVMMENDEDCADVLMQLSAVNSALRSLGKAIINEHMTHCITHALEDGDTKAVEDFQKAVEKFI